MGYTRPANAQESGERIHAIRLVLWTVLVLNVLVALAKVAWGLVSGSVAMLADGFNSMFDGVSNVVGLVGMGMAARPPDSDHPYGHSKYETYASAAIGAMLVLAAYKVGSAAIERLRGGGEPPTVTAMSFAIMLGTLAINIAVTLWERRAGRRLNSSILLADASHTTSDVFVSLGVIVGLIFVRLGYPKADAIVALFVAAAIAYTAWHVFKGASVTLSDAARIPPSEICDVVLGVPGVLGCHKIRTRGSEAEVYVDMHVQVDASRTVADGHRIVELTERAVAERFDSVADVIAHLEPFDEYQASKTDEELRSGLERPSAPRDAGQHRTRGYLLVGLAAACWATGGLTAKWMFTSAANVPPGWNVRPLGIAVDPAMLSGCRALAAFVLLAAYLLVTRRAEIAVSRRDLPFLAVFGIVALAGVHFTYFKTISLTNVATAILLEYLAPVIVLAVSVVIFHTKVTWALPVGVTLSVLGCALVVGAVGGDGLTVSTAGILWGLSSAVLFATYSLMGTYAAPRFRPWTLLVWGLGFAAAFWLVVLGPKDVVGTFADGPTAIAIIYVAVVSTIVPFGAFLTALHYIEPTQATITATLEPVLAAIAAYLLFGEKLTPTQVLGGLLVIGAIVLVQSRTAEGLALPPQD